MMTQLKSSIYALLCLLMFFSQPACAAVQPTTTDNSTTMSEGEQTSSLDDQVQGEIDKKNDDGRRKIIAEAESALSDTEEALKALKEERIDDALAKLALATGKLELVVTRDPDLALAPIDVSVTHHDVYAPLDDIEMLVESAETALIRGEVQKARRLLSGLGSELITTISSLPLASYPDAIKAATPLVDEGKIDEAIVQLESALKTIVVTDYITPLPEIRSNAMLEEAEALAEKEDRSIEEEKELESLISDVKAELELAQLLGYGHRDDYLELYKKISAIKHKTSDGKSGLGFFDSLKNSLSSMWSS